MLIPGVDTVGGFTICSSPIHLNETGEISLCVKNSDHPPANWVHSRVGSIHKIYFQLHDSNLLFTKVQNG